MFKNSSSQMILLANAALAALVSFVTSDTVQARSAKPAIIKHHTVAADFELDQSAALFLEKTARISNAADCFPLHVSQIRQIATFYQFCSEAAAAAEMDSVNITENFAVSDELAPRFNFWRRIYSLYSKDSFVLHTAQYPEIVFEIADLSRIDSGDKTKSKLAQNFLKDRRRQYARVLISLHQNRRVDPAVMTPILTPTMRRIITLMRHIDDPNKYIKAANSIRIQRGQRDFIADGFAMASRYLPAVEQEFVEQGVPLELSRLAFVESSFNLLAVSKVGASGVFQIMEGTARQFRMKIADQYDERNDPIKAARAAARLLRYNYATTGSWPLAITGYNHGAAGVMRAARESGHNDIEHLALKYSSRTFGFASQNFYCEFLAVLATLKDGRKVFPNAKLEAPIHFRVIRIGNPQSIAEIRKIHKVSNEELAIFNRDLSRRFIRSNAILPRGYMVKIPDRSPAGTVAFSSFLSQGTTP